ncbi:MAG: peptidoglycan DD-metalloendopeptidase family protein [Actinomycetota bacterium]|nr:peptidoglycan DD-metalloendopeptidase family protein [Actinomycetota bacterium]
MKHRALIVIGLVVGSLIAAPLAMAQNDPRETLREAREARAKNRADRTELARQIDVLEATDVDLIEALDALNEEVSAQERAIQIARTAVANAVAAEMAIQDRIQFTLDEAERLRSMTQDRVIAAYVAPRTESLDEQDLTRQARRDALFRYVDLDGRELLDQLRAVEDDLERLYIEASIQRDAAISAQADLETALQQLHDDIIRQQSIRAELAELVEHLDDEIAAMAAAEGEINAIIRDAQREIAREAALAWLATSSTTTTTTTTTTAPPDDGDSTGDTSDETTTTINETDPAATTTTSAEGGDEPPPTSLEDLDLIWPTTGSVTSSYGLRKHPITGTERLHTGIDIGNSARTPIWAAESGTVIFSGRMRGFGETVIISHGPHVTTLYAHMSQRTATNGSTIGKGQEVGKMGSTGFSTGDHLHFEVRVDGNPVNPRTYLP